MQTQTSNQQIAQTILRQLGGNRFVAMTGAKKFIAIKSGLSFKIGRNAKGVNYVEIKLNGKDLYDVRYLRCWGGKVTEKAVENDLYFDMLQDSFERNTGLYTSL